MVKLACPRCHTALSVPEQTLPDRDWSELKCPVCHELMERLDRVQPEAEKADLSERSPEPPRVEREAVHRGEEITQLHLIEAGGRKALLCIADQTLAEKVARTVRELEFHVVVAQRPPAVLSQLESNQYDLIVLHGSCGGQNSSENPVLLYLQRLPMALRRASFLCLLSDEMSTLDYMAAFRIGANLIVNAQDVKKLRAILNHMLTDHVASYAIYGDELRKRGTSLI